MGDRSPQALLAGTRGLAGQGNSQDKGKEKASSGGRRQLLWPGTRPTKGSPAGPRPEGTALRLPTESVQQEGDVQGKLIYG